MIVLRGGKIYDPANGIDGQVGDIWIDKEKIIAKPDSTDDVEEIDAHDLLVAPGGIEIHTHIAGAAMAMIRSLFITENGSVVENPYSSRKLAEEYLKLGYTTVFDAAMTPFYAWQTHTDLREMKSIDRGSFTSIGDHKSVHAAIIDGSNEALQEVLGWLLDVSGGYALKLVNPGIGTAWKTGGDFTTLDEPILPGDLTQRMIIQNISLAADEMGLPHCIHIHANNLGKPGAWNNFIDTMQLVDGLKAHLCHIQYYCYDKNDRGLTSMVLKVVEQMVKHSDLTFDVGQITFGQAIAATSDLQVIRWLQESGKTKWTCRIIENEGGIGILPLDYHMRDATSAVMWAVGMELMLRFPYASRLFLTTDFPNGGSFTNYPHIQALLMDYDKRMEILEKIHPAARQQTGLEEIKREYSMSEVIDMSSNGPAKSLGLKDRGNLSINAIADIRCYKLMSDKETMFRFPQLVFKNGILVIKDGKLINEKPGHILVVRPEWEEKETQIFRDEYRQIIPDSSNYGLNKFPELKQEFKVISCRSMV